MFRLYPVVECLSRWSDFWLPLPEWVGEIGADPAAWGDFWGSGRGYVELGPVSTVTDVSRVVLELALSGKKKPVSSAVLAKKFPECLIGGLALSDGDRTIFPGCCCDLNGWVEWKGLLDDPRRSPWLGHSPDAWIESNSDAMTCWADEFRDGVGRDATPSITFSRAELEQALGQVAEALDAFTKLLENVLHDNDIPEAAQIAVSFAAMMGLVPEGTP